MKIYARNQKGFTLIELSIVLVIIGIILGAVLKGQDLINNARAKKVVQWEKQWETAIWTYMDRMGRFPGDGSAGAPDGIIGNNASDNSAATDITNANFINTPPNSLTIGSYNYYLYVGNDGGYNSTGSPGTTKNVIIICKTATCSAAFSTDDLQFMQAIDATIDSTVNAGQGNVRGLPTGSVPGNFTNLIALRGQPDGGATSTSTVWSITDFGLAYWFDRPF